MGKIRLIGLLAGRDLRRRPGPAALLVVAITIATATLTLGLVLHGVTSQPYLQTRAVTNGPDVVAQIQGFTLPPPGSGGPAQQGQTSHAQIAAEIRTLTGAPDVTGHSGPYPVASAVIRFRGVVAPVEAEGRARAPASIEQPKLTGGTWVRPGGVVLERTFAEALGAGVGDRVTLNGRPYEVVGSRSPPRACRTQICVIPPATASMTLRTTRRSRRPPTTGSPGSPNQMPARLARRRHRCRTS